MTQRLGPIRFWRGLWRIVRGRPRVPPTLQDNQLLTTILKRRSVRSFGSVPLPDDIFAAILEAGRLAPSTVNLQTWTFAPFDAGDWEAAFGQPMPFNGQRAILILGDAHRARTVLDAFPRSPLVEYTMAVMNASLAAMNMSIAAEALGVGSVMLSETGRTGLLDAAYLREQLGLPAGVVPLMTIVFGYPRGPRPPMPPKLALEEIVLRGRYREPDPSAMQAWIEQMIAGYKASHLSSSFERQLKVYQSKIDSAEQALRHIALGE